MSTYTRSASFLLCTLFYLKAFLCGSQDGTTRHVREIFVGRCYDYQGTRNSVGAQVLKKRCLHLFDVFAGDVRPQKDCITNSSGIFENFFNVVNPGLTPMNKALFWSGTKDVAHELSFANDNFITLEDTFPGYLSNKLKFCGGNKTGNFNFTMCKCQWPDSVMKVFWEGASKQFARNAQGVVTVLLNGTRKNAYRKDSMFGGVELPNMNTSLVKRVKIFIAFDLDSKPVETCKTENILTLQRDIKNRGITPECIDDPNAIFYIMCANNPKSLICRRHRQSQSKKTKDWKLTGLILIGVCCALIFIITLVCIIFCRKLKTEHNPKPYDNFP